MAENRDTIIIGTRLINSTKEESFKEGIEILGRNTSQTVINTLKQIADSKSNKKKRDYARKALNRIANRLRLDSWKDFFEKADHLQKKINNKLEHYETKKEKALKIVKVLYSENNCFVIASLIKQIGDFKDPFFLPVILKYLNHKDPRVRANTVEALESINDFGNKVIKSLVARLVDESGRVKANTLKLLAKLNIIDIEEGLTYMLEKGDNKQVHSVLYVITELNDPKLYPLIEKALLNADEKIRTKAEIISKRFTIAKYQYKIFRLFYSENLIYIVFFILVIINFVPMAFAFIGKISSPEKHRKDVKLASIQKYRIQSKKINLVSSTCLYMPSESQQATFLISDSENKYIESANNKLLSKSQYYIKKRDLTKAIFTLEKAIQTYANDPVIIMKSARKLSCIYREKGNNVKAKFYWNIFIKNQKLVSKKFKEFF